MVANSLKNEEALKNYFSEDFKCQKESTEIEVFATDQPTEVSRLLPEMVKAGVLNKNFIIYGGDLISNVNLFEVIDFHHLNRASLTTVLINDPCFEKKKT